MKIIDRATVLLLVAMGAGPLVGVARAAEAPEVRMAQHQYEPRTITVARGTTIRWVNDDGDPHTVTADDGAFASRGIDTQEEYSFTFDAPGTYAYHCALHPLMTGTVVVR